MPLIQPVAEGNDPKPGSAKDIFEWLLKWFIFFSTANMAAVGWFISLAAQGKLVHLRPLEATAIFYMLQITLGVIACVLAVVGIGPTSVGAAASCHVHVICGGNACRADHHGGVLAVVRSE